MFCRGSFADAQTSNFTMGAKYPVGGFGPHYDRYCRFQATGGRTPPKRGWGQKRESTKVLGRVHSPVWIQVDSDPLRSEALSKQVLSVSVGVHPAVDNGSSDFLR